MNEQFDNDDRSELLKGICIIMLKEHGQLSIEELMNATGMAFSELRRILQSLIDTRIIRTLLMNRQVPKFELIDDIDVAVILSQYGIKRSS